MGCRCVDIPKCKRDIDRVGKMIESFTAASDMNSGSIKPLLTSDSRVAGGAYTPANLGSFQDALERFNDGIDTQVEALLTQCQTKKTDLELELFAMIAEDALAHITKGG